MQALSAAVLILAFVILLSDIVLLRFAKSLDGFGKQLAQFGRGFFGQQSVVDERALTTADSQKIEELRQRELARIRKERAGSPTPEGEEP